MNQKRLVRPTTCAICHKHMPYMGQPGHKPEVRVEAALPRWQKPVSITGPFNIFGTLDVYVHVACWNKHIGGLLNGQLPAPVPEPPQPDNDDPEANRYRTGHDDCG